MPKRDKLVDLVYINNWKSKIVNVDLLFDDYSEVLRKKIQEVKEAAAEKAPKVAAKGKEKVKKIHERIKERIAERKKKKEKKLEKELGGEEEVLEDTEL